jgi:putative peptide zinc metalloprotease protein
MAATKDAPASDLERRKKVRLRVRQDLGIAPQRYEGRTYYVVKDPVSLRYYRFKEQEHFLIKMMDGTHSLDDAQKAFELRFRPDRLTLEDLEQFGQQLLTAGLAQNESPQAGKQLFDRRKKRRRSEWMQTLTNILYIKIPVFDPERLLLKMLPYMWWMFTYTFLALSVGVMLGAVLLVLTHFQTFQDRLPAYHEFFNFKQVVYLWAALGIVKVIHEFGHGLSCKIFGGEVHEMGLLFLCFSPCMYCNVSDAWTLPSKWKRIIISGAGIYVELMIAAIATFIWWNSPGHPFVNNLSLSLMIVCSVSTVVFNGNPLMRYDGYYVLADWLEIPNLRDRANRYLQRVVMEHCLGIEVQPEPYMELTRRILFVTYAVVSWIYRWVVTFTILKFMATFLKPYKLEIISTMLALMALGSMIGWPLWRLGKNLHKRGRLPDMKMVRVTITSIVVAVVVLGFFFLPLPVSRVRQTGLVEFQPGAVEKVPVLLPGTPIKVFVVEGQVVKKGAELATFQSFELQKKESSLVAKIEEQSKLRDDFQRQLTQSGLTEDTTAQIKSKILDADTQKDLLEKQLQQLAHAKKLLLLRAPRDGVVIGLPKKDELYRPWDRGELERPFCHIADPTKLRMVVPVSPDDFELIRIDKARKEHHQEKLEVTLRIQGFGGQLWTGRVSHMPRSADKTVPLQLTTKGGGPLAMKPGSDPNNPEPQSQVYLVGIDFETPPDRAISPGALGQAKIHCEYRSAAWWAWRTLSATFDLGLW